MADGFVKSLAVASAFDAGHAARVMAELAPLAPAAMADAAFRNGLACVAGNSPYLARGMLKEGAFLDELFSRGVDDVLGELDRQALAVGAEADLAVAARTLRIAKRRAALAIALGDVFGRLDLAAVTGALTRFADAAVAGAIRCLLARAAKQAGMVVDLTETLEARSGLVVLAMGKMGGFELNYSSDVDLVVFYDEERFPFTRQGDKGIAAVDLVKDLLKLLAETTSDGYVFRVDLRLRPDAGATRIAISTEAALLYYESMGQNWERAAWIKARVCAGDATAGEHFMKSMEPFIWRKNLDYAAIEDIHSIKRQIDSHGGHARVEVAGHNIKLGRGGIREIEFFTQTQQLILGGRDRGLRDSTTLGALAALAERGHIEAEAERELAAAYGFLRMIEHRLQMIEDEQTHTMPKTQDGLDRLARFSGFESTAEFESVLRAHLLTVRAHYARLFQAEAPLSARAGSLVFTGVEEDPETLATLTQMGFERAVDVSAIIRGWHHGRVRATRGARARELLTKLMPSLLEALARTVDPRSAFSHFDRFLSGLPAGVQVFSMLLASSKLLDLVAEIAGCAPKLSDYLGRNATVLDALSDPGFLTLLPSAVALEARLGSDLARAEDAEAALDAARRFAKEESFRIGVQMIQGTCDASQAGPAYTAIADTLIAGLHALIAREMAAAHGTIPGGGFVVVAQGKLGGREMTATSDLDLVFVYSHDAEATQSLGPKPLAVSQYFARTAQRFIAGLSAMTAEGRLYEVDMRLRPSGNQGPVAVRLDTFMSYHREHSWTWERMALTRARVVSGPQALRHAVEAAIRESLTKDSDARTILKDASEMREKLAAQFAARDGWDIKFAAGGLVDIEFIAQALQLCHGRLHAGILAQNTIVALENMIQAGVLDRHAGETLIAAANLQHGLTQTLRIALDGAFHSGEATAGLKALLVRAGGTADFPALEARLSGAQQEVRGIFQRIVVGR